MPFPLVQIFLVFLRLGMTSFGGPIAHLGFFRSEFVVKRKWLAESTYADLIALCQFLPGPASSQVGIAIGLARGGILGSIAAWLGFTLPSAVALTLVALGMTEYRRSLSDGLLHGLKIAAVAVVAQALWGMFRKLSPDMKRILITVLCAALSLVLPLIWGQLGAIFLGGVIGFLFLTPAEALPHSPLASRVTKKWAVFFLVLFFTLLAVLPFIAQTLNNPTLSLFDRFYRAGSWVFGGGHVVLPLLQSEFVATGFVSQDIFVAGYGVAQAVPGPLFTFAAFLGTVSTMGPSGVTGAVIALIAAFLPSFLLVWGVFPFWEKLRTHQKMRSAMMGINSAVVGLLLAAFYHPVCTSAIHSMRDGAVALIALLLLVFAKFPSWLVVLMAAGFGYVLL